jgi:hypothetical protein
MTVWEETESLGWDEFRILDRGGKAPLPPEVAEKRIFMQMLASKWQKVVL